MKLSGILSVITIVIFWCAMGLFVHWFFVLNDEIWAVLVVSGATTLGVIPARLPKNKFFSFLFHLVTAAIPGILMVTGSISLPMFLFGIGIVVISYIIKMADSEAMDRGNWFGSLVLVIVYLIGSIMEYELMWVHFGIMVSYVFLVFIERNIRENEEYIEKVSYHAVIDVKKMNGVANMVTFIISLFMLVICLLLSFLGKIGPLASLSAVLRLELKELLSFLKRVAFTPSDVPDNGPDVGSGVPPVEEMLPNDTDVPVELPNTIWDKIIMTLLIALTIGLFIFGIYSCLRRLYRHYLGQKSAGVVEEEHIYIHKKKEKKINPSKHDKSYGNRMTIRRIYKKRIKGKHFGRREDLVNCTPTEQMNKSNADGNMVNADMVDLYEKARYSNEAVTKDDVRRMGKL